MAIHYKCLFRCPCGKEQVVAEFEGALDQTIPCPCGGEMKFVKIVV
ncbi:MAG TPA: hypothetical protein VGK71_06385 [Nitrospirota bacterium]|jgi:hypothetical protein